ncbi:DUF4440 domain-containing protein [Ensifer sp. Root127]|uniref:DUF4440 domain-containing protein n=1 Tax=Ensifer sp. Root127 TaxID=1736440 RepID=UPI00244EC4B3|nr:DUF4440 domain-containing protein [Ensifer sp. Root127]
MRALEEALHRPELRRSRAAVEVLLAEGFVEFGASGTKYHRAEMIDLLSEEDDDPAGDELRATDFSLTRISARGDDTMSTEAGADARARCCLVDGRG